MDNDMNEWISCIKILSNMVNLRKLNGVVPFM